MTLHTEIRYSKTTGSPMAIQLLTEKGRCLASIPAEQLASLIDLLQEDYLEMHGSYGSYHCR